ncbi:hypothetical protein I5559_13010 [Acinetobacter oleivorans]|uniref:hypothetical protein n=1 Tax=Acinetobacter oleivorans TaxID=1148157 RepID=UPI0019014AFC|nr:hypothetical protein [Acinetobacter oleivorans]MBJ9421308.1 hypothetical protein [Acinetobacter oleivorans]
MSDSKHPSVDEDENINSEIYFRKTIDEIKNDLVRLEDRLGIKVKEIEIPSDKASSVYTNVQNVKASLALLRESLNGLKTEYDIIIRQAKRLVFENRVKIRKITNLNDLNNFLIDFQNEVRLYQIVVSQRIQSEDFIRYKEMAQKTVKNLKIRETQLKKQVEEVKILVEQTKNLKIHDYYDLAAKENQNKSDVNRSLFIFVIILSLTIIWFSLVTKGYFGLSGYDYYFFKGSLVLTSITLITYFLKQSVKYQKMADQCKQTKLELEAFPSYVANLSNEDPLVADLRKELAMKYFGRDVDNKSNDETSNILQDQMKNTTEMVKAAMEVLKKSGSN